MCYAHYWKSKNTVSFSEISIIFPFLNLHCIPRQRASRGLLKPYFTRPRTILVRPGFLFPGQGFRVSMININRYHVGLYNNNLSFKEPIYKADDPGWTTHSTLIDSGQSDILCFFVAWKTLLHAIYRITASRLPRCLVDLICDPLPLAACLCLHVGQ